MKRAHRKTHLLIWLLLGPAIAAIIYLAIEKRPAEPVNPDLPEALISEAE